MAATTGTNGNGKQTTAMVQAKPPGLLDLLKQEGTRAELQKVATVHLTPERLLRLMVGEVRRVPNLAKCSIDSVMQCVLDMGRLGLEPGPLGHVYLVPYGDSCTLIVGYRGLIELARRSGQVQRLEAHLVYEAEANDPERWCYEAGVEPRLVHKPMLTGDRGKIVAAYMVAKLADGSTQLEVMTMGEIEAVRDRSRASKSGPWVSDLAEMCRKTVVRRGAKYLPLASEDWRRALEHDRDDFETSDEKPARPAPPTLRSALGIAAPERDDGPPPAEVERDAGEEG